MVFISFWLFVFISSNPRSGIGHQQTLWRLSCYLCVDIPCSNLYLTIPDTLNMKKSEGFFFFLTFYFALEYSRLTNNYVIVSGEPQRDSAINTRVSILPQTPLPSGCHITLSREELWDFVLTLGLLQWENRDLSDLRILRLAHSLSSGRGIGRVPDRATFTEPYQVSALLNSPPNPEKSFSCLAAW